MKRCPACGSIYLEHWKDYIFTHVHEWINCTNCDCLWIKRLDDGEWIDSSSITCQQHTYEASVRQARKFRSMAYKVARP